MSASRSAVVVALALAWSAEALAGAPSDAAAPGDQRAARAHFTQGQTLFVEERYADALAEFEAGYAAWPLPGFLVNIGNCHRHLGAPTAARAAYQRFLDEAPRSPLVAEVEGLVRSLPPATEPPPVTAPPLATEVSPTQVSEAAPSPEPGPAGVNGAPRLEVVASPEVEASRSLVVDMPRPAKATRSSFSGRWWLWGALSAAVIAGTVAVVAARGDTTTTVHDGTLGTLRR